MTTDAGTAVDSDVATYCLRLGDDALVLSQRLCEWSARSPQLEEDVALMNIALDLLGQARNLLTLAGQREGAGRTEDDLAMLRDETDIVSAQLMELDNGDFGQTMARQLLVAAYLLPLWRALTGSADVDLAAIAGKAVKEVEYHLDHARSWVVRLGDGTQLSHDRMQAGLDQVWPYVDELFDASWIDADLLAAGVAVDAAELRPEWEAYLASVLAEATLTRPVVPPRPTGGRRGVHTEAMGYLLAEMQHLHRSHPGATW